MSNDFSRSEEEKKNDYNRVSAMFPRAPDVDTDRLAIEAEHDGYEKGRAEVFSDLKELVGELEKEADENDRDNKAHPAEDLEYSEGLRSAATRLKNLCREGE